MTRTPSTPLPRPSLISRPITRMIGESGTTLAPAIENRAYRPRGLLVAALLVGPALVALTAFASVLIAGPRTLLAQSILAGMSLVVAIWLLGILVTAPLTMMKVQTMADAIEVTPPFGKQRRLRWSLIDRVERRAGLLWLHTSDGGSVYILDGGLEEGSRLLRQTILRVGPSVLGAHLRQALEQMGGTSFAGGPPAIGTYRIAPRWFLAGSAAIGISLVLVASGLLNHAIWSTALGVITVLLATFGLVVARQRITIDDESITITDWRGRARMMRWAEIRYIEQIPPELRLALRGEKRRVTLIGPFFLTPLDRDRLRDLFYVRLLDRGVPVLDRLWI